MLLDQRVVAWAVTLWDPELTSPPNSEGLGVLVGGVPERLVDERRKRHGARTGVPFDYWEQLSAHSVRSVCFIPD